jgi:hypothetical protein
MKTKVILDSKLRDIVFNKYSSLSLISIKEKKNKEIEEQKIIKK